MEISVIEYKGMAIHARADERGNGWTWTYSVGNGPLRHCEDLPVRKHDDALNEAIAAAKTEIDRAFA